LFCKWIMESELIHSPLFTWTVESPLFLGRTKPKWLGWVRPSLF
jgi:hypothetical protein